MTGKELLTILKSSSLGAKSAGAAALTAPGPLALVMAALSILSKEWLFRVTKAVGEKLSSPVVIANAWHHRSDAYSSILALLSIAWAMVSCPQAIISVATSALCACMIPYITAFCYLFVYFKAGFHAADAAAGMLVAGMIAMTGGDIMVESIKQLSDSAHEELQEEVGDILDSLQDEDVISIGSIRARQVGSAAVTDVTVEVHPDMTTTATRAVEERTQQYLRQRLSQGSQGRSVVATVHAKPNLVICPLLHHQAEEEQETPDNDLIMSDSINDASREDRNVNASTGISEQRISSESSSISASLVESQVRQQALLLYPQIHFFVTGVTVHFSSQNTVEVDCHIQVDQSTASDEQSSLAVVQKNADDLQEALETNLQEITHARIYLDLSHPAKAKVGSMSNYV
ncbi:MAG: hypothetical protein SGILL_007466 [Bacillariaceae sp.]